MTIRTITQVGFDTTKELAEIEQFREHQEWEESRSGTMRIVFTHTKFDVYPIGDDVEKRLRERGYRYENKKR